MNAGRSAGSWIAVPPSKGTSPSRISRIRTIAMAASDLAELSGEVGDQSVEHADDHALSHRRGLPRDLRLRVDRAAAVLELESDVRVGVPLTPRLLGLHAQQRAMRAGILLGHLDCAGEGQ